MNAHEITGSIVGAGMGATFTMAQLTPVDAPVVDMIVKAGAVGVVGSLFYLFMRLHFKALKEMSDTHKEIAIKQAQASIDAAAVVAKDGKEAISLLVSGHKDAVDRIEVRRAPQTNAAAVKLTAEQKFDLARLGTMRIWDLKAALMTRANRDRRAAQ
jgi:hypothetical protein